MVVKLSSILCWFYEKDLPPIISSMASIVLYSHASIPIFTEKIEFGGLWSVTVAHVFINTNAEKCAADWAN